MAYENQMIRHVRILFLSTAPFIMSACDVKQGRAAQVNATSETSHTYGYVLASAAKPRIGNPLPVGKCINMGGMLEFVREANHSGGRTIRNSDFAVIRKGGFDTVRIPIKFSAHTANTPPYQIGSAFMARVKQVVDQALANKLNVMIDIHHYKEVQIDPDGQKDRFVSMWRQISDMFHSYDNRLWFELLNEPGYQFWNKRFLNVIFDPAIEIIRRNNPTRPIIIAGNYGSQIRSLVTLRLPENDPNTHPTFHFYEPKPYTHQGAGWTHLRYPAGRIFNDEEDRPVIDSYVAQVKTYMDRTGRVPFLGEYGVIDLPKSMEQDRARYYGTISAAFASIGVQSCAWSFTNGFSLYRDGKWVGGMPGAIQTTTTLLPR